MLQLGDVVRTYRVTFRTFRLELAFRRQPIVAIYALPPYRIAGGTESISIKKGDLGSADTQIRTYFALQSVHAHPPLFGQQMVYQTAAARIECGVISPVGLTGSTIGAVNQQVVTVTGQQIVDADKRGGDRIGRAGFDGLAELIDGYRRKRTQVHCRTA